MYKYLKLKNMTIHKAGYILLLKNFNRADYP